jgi:hypothetical protein
MNNPILIDAARNSTHLTGGEINNYIGQMAANNRRNLLNQSVDLPRTHYSNNSVNRYLSGTDKSEDDEESDQEKFKVKKIKN